MMVQTLIQCSVYAVLVTWVRCNAHKSFIKTFSTPHGGGGPGCGPVGVRKGLEHLLPCPKVVKEGDTYKVQTQGEGDIHVGAYLGNFGVAVKAYSYILSLGKREYKDGRSISNT